MKNNIRKLLIFVAFLAWAGFWGGCLSCLFAKEVVLGGKGGWEDFASSKNVTTGTGRFGYPAVELAPNAFEADEDTDLLIDFENAVNPISNGNYHINRNLLKRSDQTKLEKFAGLARGNGGLSVSGRPGTFFGSEGLAGSFTLEFWLCPSVVENGEIVFKWESSKTVSNQLVYQLVNASFNKGHLEWSISNFFDDDVNPYSSHDILLKGRTTLVPDSWSLHALTYNSENGCFEYIVNGVTEDLFYHTSTGQEGGEVSLIQLGTPSEVHFCPEYTGKIDDIRIEKRPYKVQGFQSAENAGKLGHTLYVPQGGIFISKPIMVSTGSKLNSLTAEMYVPSQTAVLFYVRSGENYYNWTDTYPEWKPVESGKDIQGVTGLYFQVSAELYPDGSGENSPSITQITLDYYELPEPVPPFVVNAVAGNGTVTVSWNYSVDDTAGGYYLYYGTRPGEYLGRMAVEGDSPINVGNTTSFTLTGLENGHIYYFAVAAWSAYDDRVVGKLSKEVFARPLARLK
ncbi:Fibronectin type III domain-containing protein [Treponema sp. JC4]|nr:Fibronectin type III domain-containing protein [Treponema sp. JC4]